MTRRTARLMLGAWLLAGAATAVTTAARAECFVDEDRVTGQIVVELAPGVAIETILARYSVTALDSIPEYRMWQLDTPPGADVDAIVAAMSADPDIQRAEPHRNLENPEGVQRSIGSLDFTANPDVFRSQPAAAMIKTAPAQARYTGDGVIVAVLDTGQALGHPETSAVQDGPGLDVLGGGPSADVSANGLDDDGDGLVDEENQHGTHVAGAVHLAAPGARLLAIRVLEEDGRGQAFAVAKGILRALDLGARVVNLSLSMSFDSRAVERAIEDATDRGVVVVTAAGNRGLGCVEFPASHSDVVAVAAVDDQRVRTSYTNYGEEVNLSAPGNAVLSTYGDAQWARWTGTSFATPLVSGGVALLLEKYPGLRPPQVRDLLASTAQPDANPPDMTGLMGAGVLDLDALTLALTYDRESVRLRAEPAGTLVRWSAVKDATRYDVARGDVASLRISGADVDLGPLTCLANDTAATDTAAALDATEPAPGRVFFYVVRDDGIDAKGGSYGEGSLSSPRVPGAGDCPR